MPGMGGAELMGLLTRLKPTVKALLMSGYSEDVVRRHAESGGYRFIQKPFGADQLVEKVRIALQNG
jgi:FixJ family two-component response regulator